MASFLKPEAWGHTVVPDRSFLKGQKMVENAKIQKIECDILSNFQTMCEISEKIRFYRQPKIVVFWWYFEDSLKTSIDEEGMSGNCW